MLNRHMRRQMQALGLVAAMVTLSAQMAAAAITTDDVIATYQADGFTRVEVKVGLTQMKVEAIRGDTKVETIYDIETGNILKTETETVRAGEDTAPGFSVRERNRDFLRTSRVDEDDDDDEDDHGGDRDDDDEDDDHGGDDDDDDDDDHGGDDDSDDDDDSDEDDDDGDDSTDD